MVSKEIEEKREKLKIIERLRQSGGLTLVVGEDGVTQITVFRNNKRFYHG